MKPQGCQVKKQQGLSLIELMVALVIGLLLMAAVVQMFVGSRVTYSMQTELAKLQENARFAMQFLRRDLSRAGYTGCKLYSSYLNDSDGVAVKNVLNVSADDDGADWFANPLKLTDGGGLVSDSVSVSFTAGSSTCALADPPMVESGGEFYFQCSANHGFQKGNKLVVSDCKYMAIFEMTNDNDDDDSSQIWHSQAAGGVIASGNCVSGLGQQTDCDTATSESYTSWTPNKTIIQGFANYTYSIINNDFVQPALYRNTNEMVEGVENMQVLFGFDTDDDDSANCFSTSPDNCGAGVSLDDAVAARISLLLVSIEDNLLNTRPANEFSGTPFEGYAPNDKKLRKVFTSTVTLRNRLIEP